MKFEVGEEIELFADNGCNYGRYIIDEIAKDSDRVWFKKRDAESIWYPRPMDRIHRCRKIPKPGQQLEWDW